MPGIEPSAERNPNSLFVVVVGTALLIVFGLALIASLVNLWPSIELATTATSGTGASANTRTTVRLLFALVTVKVTPSMALLLLVVLTGMLGSLVHAATSFTDFVGNRRFYVSWTAWYLLRPVVGASLAVLLYFAVRGGFLSDGAQSSSINPYGIAAIAGLAGLFSKQATDKLREVFETLFHVSSTAGDAQRKDDLANAVPVLASAEPAHLVAGLPPAGLPADTTLILHGEHFHGSATTGRINGLAQATEVLSSQQIKLAVPKEFTANRGALTITVFTAPPGGGESAALIVPVL